MWAENEMIVPDLEELIAEIPQDDLLGEETLAHQYTAALILGVSLAMGMVGNLFFYYNRPGLNIAAYVVLFLGVAFWLLVYLRRPVFAHNAIFAVPAAVFALMLGVRLAPELLMLNTLAMLGALVVVMHFTTHPQFLGGHWRELVQSVQETVFVAWLYGPLSVLPPAAQWFKRLELDSGQIAHLKSVLRGALITLPVVTVFALLLGSADAVFGSLTQRTLALLLPGNVGDMIGQLMIITFFAGACMAALKILLLGRTIDYEPFERSDHSPGFRLDMIETSMVLGAVNLLFLAFVIIQARYFFGGEANINTQGYTYAEYARRGFYELLAVSCMTALLIITVDSVTYRKRKDESLFRVLVVSMTVLAFVILVSALRRLSLYENAYGYTRIRVMSGVFMIWLAMLLGVLLVAVLCHRHRLFWIGCIVAGMGFLLTLNVMNMDGFIASRNIDRFADTGKLDVPYLLTLSDDAIPAIAPLIENDALDSWSHDQLMNSLSWKLRQLDNSQKTRGLLGYHVGKARAWRALDHYRDVLEAYTPR
jgi:hypothetical protein